MRRPFCSYSSTWLERVAIENVCCKRSCRGKKDSLWDLVNEWCHYSLDTTHSRLFSTQCPIVMTVRQQPGLRRWSQGWRSAWMNPVNWGAHKKMQDVKRQVWECGIQCVQWLPIFFASQTPWILHFELHYIEDVDNFFKTKTISKNMTCTPTYTLEYHINCPFLDLYTTLLLFL